MAQEFSVGDKVQIVVLPPYVKTAEPIPMLRPPHLVHLGEEGTVTGRNPGGTWSVRFTKGTFFLDGQYLDLADSSSAETTSHVADSDPAAETDTE